MTTYELIKKLGDAEFARKNSYAHGMGVMEGILISVAYESPDIEEIVRKIVARQLETIS
jgi:hypothetical protein